MAWDIKLPVEYLIRNDDEQVFGCADLPVDEETMKLLESFVAGKLSDLEVEELLLELQVIHSQSKSSLSS